MPAWHRQGLCSTWQPACTGTCSSRCITGEGTDARLIGCAAPLLLPSQQPPAVASQILEDWKAANTDLLGKPRKLGTGERGHLAPDHAFGLPSMRHGPEPGVDKLIQVKRGCSGLKR